MIFLIAFLKIGAAHKGQIGGFREMVDKHSFSLRPCSAIRMRSSAFCKARYIAELVFDKRPVLGFHGAIDDDVEHPIKTFPGMRVMIRSSRIPPSSFSKTERRPCPGLRTRNIARHQAFNQQLQFFHARRLHQARLSRTENRGPYERHRTGPHSRVQRCSGFTPSN